MAVTSSPTTVAHRDTGFLNAGISAAATTITVSPIYKTVNGVRTKQGLDSTAGFAEITQGNLFELISFDSVSVNATTKISTLTGVRRGLSVNATTQSLAAGTGKVWAKNASFSVVDSANYIQATAFVDKANTFTALQTISAGLTLSGTTAVLKLNELTTTQRDALTPTEGMLIKNSTTGTNQQYVGGAWADIGDAGTPNGSTTVAGKFEEATVAEQGTATATGGSGARLVPAVANLVKTSSGAGDENKIAILDSTGKFASGFMPSGGTLTITNKTADATLTSTDSAAVITSNGAASNILVTLPSASAGLYHKFIPVTYGIAIQTASGDTINTENGSATMIFDRVLNDYIELVALDSTVWSVTSKRGNGWTSGGKGYFTGGNNAGSHYTAIDDMNYVDETSGTISAVLASGSEDHMGVSTTIYGYVMGGTTDGGSTSLNTIQKLTMYGTEVRSTITATLDGARYSGSSGMSRTSGYALGGENAGLKTTISALVFATEAEANISAVMAVATWRAAGGQSSLKCYTMSGSENTGGGSLVATIKNLTFSTEAIANNANSFSAAEARCSGMSGPLAVYQIGGQTATTTIRKLLIADETTSNLAATLDATHVDGGAVSGPIKGYVAGADASGTSIEDLNYLAETSTALAATLGTGRGQLSSVYPWSI